MTVLIWIAGTLAGAYALLMLVYLYGWLAQGRFRMQDGYRPHTKVSIIIAARNEALNIGNCLVSLINQRYPKELLEIIVVDDFSEDGTAAAVEALAHDNPVRLLPLSSVVADRTQITAFKKTALEAGIAQSKGAFIITTDADCEAGPEWLRRMVALYEERAAQLIIGPVDFITTSTLVAVFQGLDFRTMQGITGAAQRLRLGHMANGANLAFSRAAYDAIGGYEGTKHIASGDDYLLLVKMAAHYPDGIHYLKSQDAIMYTAPQPTWRALLNQRIRWASKSGKYKDDRLTAILALVYLFNLSLVILACTAPFSKRAAIMVGCLMLVKIMAEMAFLLPVSGFFRKRRSLWMFPLLQPLHVLYIVLAGFFGMIGSYEWKGRRLG